MLRYFTDSFGLLHSRSLVGWKLEGLLDNLQIRQLGDCQLVD